MDVEVYQAWKKLRESMIDLSNYYDSLCVQALSRLALPEDASTLRQERRNQRGYFRLCSICIIVARLRHSRERFSAVNRAEDCWRFRNRRGEGFCLTMMA